jgi:hypothetical protein
MEVDLQQNITEINFEQLVKVWKKSEILAKGNEAFVGGITSHGEDPIPYLVGRPPIGVSVASHKILSVGKENGDSKEGEDPKSPSFT